MSSPPTATTSERSVHRELRDEEVAFLEEEFELFQMQDGDAETLDYREAEESLEDLMLDLRGL
ncbi:MAG: hypothetical protein J07HB67_02314 [halophilic archaeon J07HB67]|nr:MAG: hypothetical protein J07HB67_02314 [halophilic archaeon J07HB67]